MKTYIKFINFKDFTLRYVKRYSAKPKWIWYFRRE